jgi:hypothetical protein
MSALTLSSAGSDGVVSPYELLMWKSGLGESRKKEASMSKVTMIGLDLAKNAFSHSTPTHLVLLSSARGCGATGNWHLCEATPL